MIQATKQGKLLQKSARSRDADLAWLEKFMKERQALAKKHGLTEKDMWDAIAKVRAQNRKAAPSR